MALFLQKPVFWNTNNYIRPSGERATSGFPQYRGYGHEEWNNSPRMQLLREGKSYRAFHTEGIGNAPIEQNVGQTFVFMTASHDGIQELVGIAAKATCLVGEEQRQQREVIAKELSLHDLWEEAWSVPSVQLKHENSIEAFKEHWTQDLNWIANWLCPEEYYWWLDEPLKLNPLEIIGKNRLLTMYGRYTRLDHSAATRFINAIPSKLRDSRWNRISEAIHIAQNTQNLVEGTDSPIQSVGSSQRELMTTEEVESTDELVEGATKTILVNAYERSLEARKKCIEHYGYKCQCCGFNFESKYGEWGKNFVHVHHLKPLGEIKALYVVNPVEDLIPLCANCHAMIHRTSTALSIEELKAKLQQ